MGVTPREPMKLTVGPLPAAVYWRRRALVLGAMLLIVLGTAALFSGGGKPASTSTGSGPGAAGGSPSATGLLTPVIGGSLSDVGPSGNAATTMPATNPTTLSTQAVTGPCTDEEIQLTPSPEPSVATAGSGVKIVLKIRNVSGRTCTRDVGSGPQELQIRSGSDVVWSSDYCQGGAGGHDVRTFGPGVEATFYVTWDGDQVGSGCANGPQAKPGTYQIVARLGTKLSSPVPLVIQQGAPS